MKKRVLQQFKSILAYNIESQIDLQFLESAGIKILRSPDKKSTMNLLRRYEVGAVIVCNKPGENDSISFLRYLMHQYPLIQRIYFSKIISSDLMETAINKAHINYFSVLPIKNEELFTIATKALKRYNDLSRPLQKFDELADVTVDLMEDMEKYHVEANSDKLTGLLNRRSFDSSIDRAINLFKRKKIPFSLVMIDLDKFKLLNDTYGHQAGDAVLRIFANLLMKKIRFSEDSAFRYGGEEFAIISSGSSADEFKLSVERILNETRNKRITFEGKKIRFTFCAGIANMAEKISKNELIKRADSALYFAKQNGRNQVVVYNSE